MKLPETTGGWPRLDAYASGHPPALIPCELAGTALLLHASGVVLVPAHGMMIVADLHLEKATAFAARGQMLPPYETLDTLRRLLQLVTGFSPQTLVLLGDSFHSHLHSIDDGSPARAMIDRLAGMTRLVWIAGNHDPEVPLTVPGIRCAAWRLDTLLLRHAPADDGEIEIIGHLHPAARLQTRAGRQRRKCFLLSAGRLLMPAFGTLTGGLDVREPAIACWFPKGEARAFLLGKERLYEVPAAALT